MREMWTPYLSPYTPLTEPRLKRVEVNARTDDLRIFSFLTFNYNDGVYGTPPFRLDATKSIGRERRTVSATRTAVSVRLIHGLISPINFMSARKHLRAPSPAGNWTCWWWHVVSCALHVTSRDTDNGVRKTHVRSTASTIRPISNQPGVGRKRRIHGGSRENVFSLQHIRLSCENMCVLRMLNATC